MLARMGYGYMAWRTRIGVLREMFGQGENTWVGPTLDHIIGDQLERLDRNFAHEIAKGCPRAIDCLEAIERGDDLGSSHGFMYAYAVEAVLDFMAYPLDNAALYPTGVDYDQLVDAVLEDCGVKSLRLSTFTYGKLPFRIPMPDDFPGYGHMDEEQVRRALAELDACSYDTSDHVGEAIACMHGWLRSAAEHSEGIVAFFH